MRIHLAAVDPLRLRAMVAALEAHPGLALAGTSDLAPAILQTCVRTRVRVAVVLAGAVPVEVLHAVASLRALGRRVETVALVEDPPDPDRIQALLSAGARGILSEKVGADEINRAVRAVAVGGCVLGPAATDHVLARAGSAQQQFL